MTRTPDAPPLPLSLSLPLRERLRALFEELRPGREDLLDQLRGLYDAHFHFEDPMQALDDVDDFLETTRKLMRRSRDLAFSVRTLVGTDDEFFMTWTMRLVPKLGPKLEVEGISHVRASQGKVLYQRDYWDMTSLVASGVPAGTRLLRAALRPFT